MGKGMSAKTVLVPQTFLGPAEDVVAGVVLVGAGDDLVAGGEGEGADDGVDAHGGVEDEGEVVGVDAEEGSVSRRGFVEEGLELDDIEADGFGVEAVLEARMASATGWARAPKEPWFEEDDGGVELSVVGRGARGMGGA